MTIKLFLIRHAESKDNIQGRFSGLRNVELTDKGVEQAEKLSLRLKYKTMDTVYCSDLKRAKQTAEIVFAKKGIEIKTNSKFRELDLGAWEGHTYEEVKAKFGYGDEFNPWMGNVGSKIIIPQGEKIKSFNNKVMNELSIILEQYRAKEEDKNIAIVCHGVVIRAILSNALKMDLNNMWYIEQDSTALNIISYVNNAIIINLINDTAHLEDWCNMD